MYVGRGARARIAPGTNRRGIRGVRMLVRTDPSTALQEGVAALRSARFVLAAHETQRRLSTAHPEWKSQVLTIGRPSSGKWWRGFDDDGVENLLLPMFWPKVALTLAVATARQTTAGTELVILAHPSMLRAGTRTNDSGPLLAKAAAALQRRFAASGALLHLEEVSRLDDDECPASGGFVRKRLGWT